MRFGSICSGIEAASVAFGPIGWEAAWFSEVDVAASLVLAHHYGATAPVNMPSPNEPDLKPAEIKSRQSAMKSVQRYRKNWGDRKTNWGDMTRLPELILSDEAEAPDVLCGGTPCQAFSLAGARQGLDDARGNLTLTFVEIANAIDIKRAEDGDKPSIVFWENVPGVLSDKTNAFGCFLAGLAGEDLPLEPSGKRWPNAGVVLGPQRAIAWVVKDAQYFGLAQRRKRVFVVASARDGFDPAEVLFEFDGLRRDSAPSREAGQGFTHDVGSGFEVAGTLDNRARGGGFPGTDGACSGHVVAVDPVGCFWNGEQITQTLDAVLHKGQTMPEKNRFPAVLQPVPILEPGARTGKSTTDVRAGLGIGDAGDPIYTLQAGKQHGVAFAQNTRDEVRYMGGDGQVVGALAAQPGMKQTCYVAVSPTIRAGGNATGGNRPPGTDVDTADSLICVSVTGDLTHALNTANNGKGSSEDGRTGRGVPTIACTPAVTVALRGREGGNTAELGDEIANALRTSTGGSDKPHVLTTMAVRRLTPVECERLQGFPDNYTAVPNGSKIAADGPRYKQIGNSWAVPCVSWIGRRIEGHVKRLDSHTIDASIVWLICP